MTGSRVHRYHATCTWSGSTAQGYDGYERNHSATVSPAGAELTLSADPAFGGDASLLDPEQLVLVAASSCQLLSFLAVASRARLDVTDYRDDADATMDEAERPVRITEIHLRPRITVRGPVSEPRVQSLVQTAHRECFVANSLNCDITVTPSIDVVE